MKKADSEQNRSTATKGIGAALGALLASCLEDDLACLQTLKEHCVITESEYTTLVARLQHKKLWKQIGKTSSCPANLL